MSMAHLVLDPAAYTVAVGAETVELLAKEFALLQFLYEHRNQAFSREQLLDRVWALEYPVERTVDDHIYRLRKKLARWSHIRLNTIRGYGYSLTVEEPRKIENPSIHDEEMQSAVRGLFEKYHLLGQGKSIVALAAQHEVLGFEIDAFFRRYIRFIQGDIRWFLDTGEIAAGERLYWLLLLYWGIAADPERALEYCEAALRQKVMTPEQHREMEILNILEVYADAGQPEKAIARFPHTRRVMESDSLTGFVMPVAIMEMYVHLTAANLAEADRSAARLERLLQSEPYIREIGRFHIMKGLRLLADGAEREAEERLDEGLEVLGMALHMPLYFAAVHQIRLFLHRHRPDSRLRHKYAALYDSLDKEYRLSEVRPEMERRIESLLNGGDRSV